MSENCMEICDATSDSSKSSDTPKPFLIGVAGGTASGKSSVCSKIVELLDRSTAKHKRIVTVSMDLFYKDLTDEEVKYAKIGEYNFDHPKAFDFRRLSETLQKIVRREPVEIQEYDARNFKRKKSTVNVPSDVDIVLVEGILVFYNKEIRDLFHMKLFVDSDADTRLSRRVLRDTNERGRELGHVLNQYTKFVKPAFEDFCLPTKKYADVILPRGADNKVGIDVIVQNLEDKLCCTSGSCCGSRRHRSISRTSSESGTVSRPH